MNSNRYLQRTRRTEIFQLCRVNRNSIVSICLRNVRKLSYWWKNYGVKRKQQRDRDDKVSTKERQPTRMHNCPRLRAFLRILSVLRCRYRTILFRKLETIEFSSPCGDSRRRLNVCKFCETKKLRDTLSQKYSIH